jgi:hypothetical protein
MVTPAPRRPASRGATRRASKVWLKTMARGGCAAQYCASASTRRPPGAGELRVVDPVMPATP